MDYKTLLVTVEDGIALVKVNRPEALNALNGEVLTDLASAFTALAADDAVKGVILTGEGKAFVAGADIAAMRDMSTQEGRAFMIKGQAVMAQIDEFAKPVIAAVNGFALGGGCELSMAADIRFASEKAKFGQPEVNLGIIPGFGGTQRLTKYVGRGNAKYLIYGADIIDAQEAYRLGLVQKVFPAETLLEETYKFMRQILAKAPIAIRVAKVAINNGESVDLKNGVAFEAEAMTAAFSSEDRVEGMSAFLEKRPANFRDK